ncbi:MAG: hydrogenase iron-sulfur subunit [Anaerolineales bacterium]|nr:hydrogenase iron-sulfur subunit [Anaerolineales bacterium]
MSESYEPIIVGFLCNWCSYRAADLAGTARLHYAPNMRPIRVMCSGRVEPEMVLKALANGADGVLIAGCHPGECHYIEGNLKALRRHAMLQRLLMQFGIEPERVQILWASASEGPKLAEAVDQMTARLREMGPLQWSKVAVDRSNHREAHTADVGAAVPNIEEVR